MAAKRTKKRAHEVVADQLRQQIVGGELTEGQRLPSEEEMTAQLGIARTTLREALRVLESQGLIVIRRGRGGGPVVTHPDLRPIAMAFTVSLQLQGTTVGDLDAARRMIEPALAGELARRRNDDDLEALEHAVERAAEAAEADDGPAFGIAATDVHATIVERSGNHTLATVSRLLQNLVLGYYTRHADEFDQDTMRRAVRSYRKFLRLLREGDAAAAEAHWRALMTDTFKGHRPDEPVTVYANLA